MNTLKSLLPSFVKYPLWFVFKSPQRKLGWYTLWLDIGAYLKVYIINQLFKKKSLEPISICVGIFNRSDVFLNHFIKSLVFCKHPHLIELSVFDFGSTDINDLKTEIEKTYKGKLVFKSQTGNFTRAVAFNNAVNQCSYKKVLICDADFSLPVDLVKLCNKYTPGKIVWFPIVFYLYKNKPEVFDMQNGEWMIWGGKGILACNKSHFEQVGKLDERFTEWGYEDEELWQRFYINRFFIIRTKCRTLLHHWHPSLNPKYKKLEELADSGML